MEVHVIDIVMYTKGEEGYKLCGTIGMFSSTKTFDEAYKRAKENVLPRLNNWVDDKEKYSFKLLTYWVRLDEYNEAWEYKKVKNLLG